MRCSCSSTSSSAASCSCSLAFCTCETSCAFSTSKDCRCSRAAPRACSYASCMSRTRSDSLVLSKFRRRSASAPMESSAVAARLSTITMRSALRARSCSRRRLCACISNSSRCRLVALARSMDTTSSSSNLWCSINLCSACSAHCSAAPGRSRTAQDPPGSVSGSGIRVYSTTTAVSGAGAATASLAVSAHTSIAESLATLAASMLALASVSRARDPRSCSSRSNGTASPVIRYGSS
mmetsp:Transcript_7111/g.17691  ORF Transcript_7111/g.17691 Transcript_7111/m.17691 type:complete len:237 (-) Transcript_7111:133-843(-)